MIFSTGILKPIFIKSCSMLTYSYFAREGSTKGQRSQFQDHFQQSTLPVPSCASQYPSAQIRDLINLTPNMFKWSSPPKEWLAVIFPADIRLSCQMVAQHRNQVVWPTKIHWIVVMALVKSTSECQLTQTWSTVQGVAQTGLDTIWTCALQTRKTSWVTMLEDSREISTLKSRTRHRMFDAMTISEWNYIFWKINKVYLSKVWDNNLMIWNVQKRLDSIVDVCSDRSS